MCSRKSKSQSKAVTYLVPSCTDKAFNTFTNAKVHQNAYDIWEMWRKEFEADNDDDLLVGLVRDFDSVRLEAPAQASMFQQKGFIKMAAKLT
jgi:hypothetical protein